MDGRLTDTVSVPPPPRLPVELKDTQVAFFCDPSSDPRGRVCWLVMENGLSPFTAALDRLTFVCNGVSRYSQPQTRTRCVTREL